jgi:cyclopropane-fatty-acyl-phospholipid synthase
MLIKTATDKLLKQLAVIRYGSLKLTLPDGTEYDFAGQQPGPTADIILHRWQVISNLIRKGDIGFADDYRQGYWDTSDLIALTTLGLENRQALDQCIAGSTLSRALAMVSYLFKINTLQGSRKNIHAHYDLGNAFYELWLDPSMTYSSAIFNEPDEDLTQAQHNKYDRILDCLQTDQGSILEVGCGWGGFAERALHKTDFSVKGITLSEEQHRFAGKRLQGQANIALEDYRHQQGKFDYLVSIEMFEAVGERFWPTYFSKMASLLNQKGRAVVQTITMNEQDFSRYRRGGDFIRSFIFPGGMLPSPSKFEQVASTAGLKTETPYFFGRDYATTLKHWLDKFDSEKHNVLALGFDEPFIRLWRFYLAACISGFNTGRTDVMQIELRHA